MAKSISDKVDVGMIMVYTKQSDIDKLEGIIRKIGCEKPAIKMSIYKNRGGRLNNIYVWCKDDRDTSRITPLFITNWNYEFIDVQDTQIKITSENAASAF